MEKEIKVGTKIKLKKEMGFLNKIGKEYTISDIDEKNNIIQIKIPFDDYIHTPEIDSKFSNQNGILMCTANLKLDFIKKYFTIEPQKKEIIWNYKLPNGKLKFTKNKYSEWMEDENTDLIYYSIYLHKYSIVKCQYRFSNDGKIQLRSYKFMSRINSFDNFFSKQKENNKSYITSSYAVCNKKYDCFSLQFGLTIAKMRMQLKLAQIELESVLETLHKRIMII